LSVVSRQPLRQKENDDEEDEFSQDRLSLEAGRKFEYTRQDMKPNALRTMVVIALSLATLALVAPARAAQQDKPEPPAIIRKTTGVLLAMATYRVEAVYPSQAMTTRTRGMVVVEVTIDEEGRVISARTVSGPPLLADAAETAARLWMFKPTMLQGSPVKVIGTLMFNFIPPDVHDPAREIERLKRSIAEHPDVPKLHDQLGHAYEDNRQFDEALKAYQRAVALKPDYAEAQVAIGDLQMKLNRYKEALDAYHQAVLLDLTPEAKAIAYRSMALIYYRSDRFAEAIEPLKQAIALAPQGSLYLNLGLTYLKLGDKALAMKQYEMLKESDSILAEQLLKMINEEQ
jgi:TonB family protein